MNTEANTDDLVDVLKDLVAREGLDRWHNVVRDLAFNRQARDREYARHGIEEVAPNRLDEFYTRACDDYLTESAATVDLGSPLVW